MPGIIAATFSLLPHILAAQIEIQNSLLALYYTTLHKYCEEQQFPSPPPPMESVIQAWEEDHLPVQGEVESIACLANAKSVKQAGSPEDSKGSSSILPNGLGIRRTSGQSVPRKQSDSPVRTFNAPSLPFDAKSRISSVQSSFNNHTNNSNNNTSSSSTTNHHNSSNSRASYSTAAPSPSLSSPTSDLPEVSPYQTPGSAYAPAAPRSDYFSRERQPQTSGATTPTNIANMAAAAAAKKKPPPPPPKMGSSNNGLYVTAIYEFGGQGPGDLAFREGDRIRVLKKTESTDDWWEGELRGIRGSFPANYCE